MRLVARLIISAVVVMLALTVVGCGKKDVVAEVNGEAVKNSEVEAQLAQIKKTYPDLFKGADGKAREADFRNRIIDNLINTILIKQAAVKQGVKVTDKELDGRYSELRRNFANEKAFKEALAKAGLDEAKLREQLRTQALTQGLIDKLAKDIKISEAELKRYYDQNKEQFKDKAGVHAWHILFEEKDKDKAKEVLDQVKAGSDFKALARKHSKDPGSASKGGDLGWPTTPYVPEFQKALDELEPGETYPDIVKTQFGYHIIKVVEKRAERQRPFKEVKDEIRGLMKQQRQAQAFNDHIEKLRKEAKIERKGQPAETPATK